MVIISLLAAGVYFETKTPSFLVPSSEQVLQGANQELVRILEALNEIKKSGFNSGMKIILDRNESPLAVAVPYARQYLRTHYQGESAESWIRKYLYRSPAKGEVIYLQHADGRKEPLRDVFLEKLANS